MENLVIIYNVQVETNPALVSGGCTRCAVHRYHRIEDLLLFPVHVHLQFWIIVQHPANSIAISLTTYAYQFIDVTNTSQ